MIKMRNLQQWVQKEQQFLLEVRHQEQRFILDLQGKSRTLYQTHN